MRILGIDPGSRVTGYGIIDAKGNRLWHVGSGVVTPDPRSPLPARLKTIYDEVSRIIADYRPEVAVIEEVFMAKNPRAALVLGHARGTAMLAAVNAHLAVHEYSALQIKSAVVGYGRAEKRQVQQMISILLSLPELPREDAADALGAAICHANSSPLGRLLDANGRNPLSGDQHLVRA